MVCMTKPSLPPTPLATPLDDLVGWPSLEPPHSIAALMGSMIRPSSRLRRGLELTITATGRLSGRQEQTPEPFTRALSSGDRLLQARGGSPRGPPPSSASAAARAIPCLVCLVPCRGRSLKAGSLGEEGCGLPRRLHPASLMVPMTGWVARTPQATCPERPPSPCLNEL